jgi:hypothetical protein
MRAEYFLYDSIENSRFSVANAGCPHRRLQGNQLRGGGGSGGSGGLSVDFARCDNTVAAFDRNSSRGDAVRYAMLEQCDPAAHSSGGHPMSHDSLEPESGFTARVALAE